MPRLLLALVLLLPASARAEETLWIAPDLYAPAPAGEPDPEAAAELLLRAKRAAAEGQKALALQLASAALRHDPNEPTCRRVLGYQQTEGRWLTAYQRQQTERGYTWDPRFGWVHRDDLPRYEAGDRRPDSRRRRWVSADKDASLHATIESGWQVRTDHFVVTTNHSLAAAAGLAAELEAFFQAWRQLFAGYYLTDSEIRGRFTGRRNARSRARPMRVIYHRDQQQYIAALRHKQPRIADTVGIYFDDTREAHFFAEADESAGSATPFPLSPLQRATLYHEAAHQLFQEMTRTRKNVGAEANFWLVEGVALYLESLTPNDESAGSRGFTVGGADAGRLPAARRRLLAESYYVPVAELSALRRDDLQRRTDLVPLYSQMAGVATYLIDGGDATRRQRLVTGLRKLYSAKTRAGDLPNWLGVGFDDLDAGYRRYLQNLP